MSTVQEHLATIPLVTRVLLVVNIAVHVAIFFTSASLNKFAISGALVAYDGEYYRIVSAAFVHSGIMHIGMNMMSLLQLGPALEFQFGSYVFFFMTLWSVFLVGFFYVAMAWGLSFLLGPAQMYQMGVGFSGILFTHAVIESFHCIETSRSVFGLFNVPAKIYPFILLIILQVVIPGISFIGHLSGIIVGLLIVSGAANVCLPSLEFIQSLETSGVACIRGIPSASGFVPSSNRSLVHSSLGGEGQGRCGACVLVWTFLSIAAVQLWNLFATLLHIVGFPTDRVCAAIANCWKSLRASCYNCWQQLARSLSGAGAGVEAGARANDSEVSGDVEIPRPGAFSLSGGGDRRGNYVGLRTQETLTKVDIGESVQEKPSSDFTPCI